MTEYIIGIFCILTLAIGLCLLAKEEIKFYEKKLKNELESTKLIIEELKK